jgi:chromate transporter
LFVVIMSTAGQSQPESALVPVSLSRFAVYFLKLGTFGFGGPIALAGYMQRDLVEQKRWITREDYLEGLALAQLAPGPLAAQLAIYLGYVRGGTLGASLTGLAFISPSFLMVMALAAAYTHYGGLSWMQGVFYGIGAAVIAIIAKSAVQLARMTLRKDVLLWIIASVLAIVTAVTEREIVWLLILGGLTVFLIRSSWRQKLADRKVRAVILPILSLGLVAGSSSQLLRIFWYFTKAGMFVFGSGLAIVPFLYGGVVQQYHWLNDRQFLDAVAVAMITPGPVVITSGFIGYLVAGPLGALAAACGVFLPVYIVVLLVSPHFKRISKNPELRALLQGITAGATGAIAGAVVVLGRRSIHDLPTALLALAALVVITRWKVPEPAVIAVAGVCGVLLYRG